MQEVSAKPGQAAQLRSRRAIAVFLNLFFERFFEGVSHGEKRVGSDCRGD